MLKTTSLLALIVFAALAATPTVRTMYTDAMAREQAVRPSLAADNPAPAVLTTVRAAIARYEAVVRRYPASSYSDNALWQGAHLSLDAYKKFGQQRDKETGLRLLRQLATMFPTSKLAAKVPREVVAANALSGPNTAAESAPAPVSTPAPTAPAPTPRAVIDEPVVPVPTRGPEKPTSSAAPVPTGVATVKSIRRTILPDAVRIVIELDTEVDFKQDRIANPSRVYLDLAETKAIPSLVDRTLRFDSDADIVRQVRVGRHTNNATRVVIDAAGISSYSIYPLYAPYRLVIDCVRTGPTALTASAAPATPSRPASTAPTTPVATTGPGKLAARAITAPRVSVPAIKPAPIPSVLESHALASTLLRSAPSNSPQHGLLIADAYATAPPIVAVAALPKPVAKPPAAPAPARTAAAEPITGPASSPITAKAAESGTTPAPPAARNSTGGFSIARQLGLGVSRIVIDAGHGGHDPGAQGRGVVESELTLDIALRLEKLLQKAPGVEVVMTRRTDEFIQLQDRTAIANREGADLFLSIHANASNTPQAHGIETYFLNFASNLSAAAVAARENAASGQAMNALPDIVKAIALNNKLDESRDFATAVQHSMITHLRGSNKEIRDLGVKQAPFVVLIGASMPSVLAEISFLTNPQEARLLKSSAYRDRIAEALFQAVRKYQTSLRSTVTAATQPPQWPR